MCNDNSTFNSLPFSVRFYHWQWKGYVRNCKIQTYSCFQLMSFFRSKIYQAPSRSVFFYKFGRGLAFNASSLDFTFAGYGQLIFHFHTLGWVKSLTGLLFHRLLPSRNSRVTNKNLFLGRHTPSTQDPLLVMDARFLDSYSSNWFLKRT